MAKNEDAVEENGQAEVAEVEIIVANDLTGAAGEYLVEATKNGKKAVIPYVFGADLDAMVELFGSDVTYSNAKANIKIKLQAAMRSRMAHGAEKITELTTIYKPGMQLDKLVTINEDAAVAMFDNMSDDDKLAMIEKLQARMG